MPTPVPGQEPTVPVFAAARAEPAHPGAELAAQFGGAGVGMGGVETPDE